MARRLILFCALSSLVCVAPASRLARAQEQPRAAASQQAQQTQQRGEDDPAAPAGWKRYSFRYGGGDTFSVVFPRAPEESTDTSERAGTKVVVHSLMSDTPNGVYFVGCVDIQMQAGMKLTPESSRVFYESFWRHFAEGMAKGLEEYGFKAEITPLGAKRILVGGREGQEQDFTVGKLHGRYRAATGDTQVYIILAVSLAGWPSAELESFSDSFKIRAP
jgi:hypothetical protein